MNVLKVFVIVGLSAPVAIFAADYPQGSMVSAQTAAQKKTNDELKKYPPHLPKNESDQRALDAACQKSPVAFYTLLMGPQYVKDHQAKVRPTWKDQVGKEMNPSDICALIQQKVALDLSNMEKNNSK